MKAAYYLNGYKGICKLNGKIVMDINVILLTTNLSDDK